MVPTSVEEKLPPVRAKFSRYQILSAILFGLLLFTPSSFIEQADSSGFIVALRIRDLAIFMLWSQTILLAGLATTSRFTSSAPSATLSGATALLVGVAVVGGVLTVLGLAGAFGSNSVRLLALLALLLTSTPKSLVRGRSLGRGMASEIRVLLAGRSGAVLGTMMFPLAAALLTASLGPEVSWDGAMYHLDTPAQFIRDGRISLPDDNLHVAFVSAPQMVAAVPIAAGTVAYLAFSQVLAFVGTVVLVGTSLQRWVSARAGKLSMLLLLASTGLLAVSSVGQVDAIMVLGVLTVLLAVISSDIDGRTPNPVLLGLTVGAAFLTKYQAVPYLLGVAALLGYLLARGRVAMSPKATLFGLAVTAALIGPFLLKNWILLGGPLYPFFLPRVVEPWFAEAGLRLAEDVELPNLLAQARTQFNPVDWLIHPELLTVEESGKYFGFPAVYLLGLLAFFTHRRRLAAYLVVPAIVGLGLVVLVSPATNLRYLLPVLPIFAMSTSIFVATVTENVRSGRTRFILFGIAVATLVPFFSWILDEADTGRWAVGAGVESEENWYQRPANQSLKRLSGLAAVLESDSADAGRVLLLYEARGLTLGPRVIQDNVFVTWNLLADGLQGSCFPGDQISRVVFGSDVYEYLVRKGVADEELRAEAWESFKEKCLELETTLPGYEVYRVVGH